MPINIKPPVALPNQGFSQLSGDVGEAGAEPAFLATERISVIIPTRNAGTDFPRLLRLLKGQTLPPHELIVIDTESTDGTPEAAAQAGALVLTIRRSEFDHGGARNRAAAAASGSILLFMTQDAMPCDAYLLERLARSLNETGAGYAYARQLARPDADSLERMSREYNYPSQSMTKGREDIDALGIKTFFCSNVCAAIRRDTFQEMGGFLEPTHFNEDLFLAARLVLSGRSIAYTADACVIHSHSYTPLQQFKRFYDNGVSMASQPWMLPYAAVGKEGAGLVKAQLKELARTGKWLRIPGLVAENAAKLIGFKLGMSSHRLPAALQRRFSMYRPR